MAQISVGFFGGENRKKSPFLLASGESVIAENLDFSNGKFSPFVGMGDVQDKSGSPKTIAFFDGKERLLDYEAEVAVAGVPRGGKILQLLICGEGQVPQVITKGGTARFRLGAPWRKTWRPHLVNAATSVNAGGTNRDKYAFACSVVMKDGSESPLSGLLQFDNANPGGTSNLDDFVNIGEGGTIGNINFDIPVNNFIREYPLGDDTELREEFRRGESEANAPVGGWGYPAAADYETPQYVRLWRTIDSGAYHLMQQLEWSRGVNVVLGGSNVKRFVFALQRFKGPTLSALTAQFLGIETRPRIDMRGVLLHPNGFACGFAGNFLCFSALEQYGIWPRSYEVQVAEGNILAIIEHNSSLYVFPENSPPLKVHLDSPNYNNIQRLESSYRLREENKRTVVNMGELGVFFAVRQGIVQLSGGGGRLITDAVIDENDFAPPVFAFSDADEYFGARADGTVLYLTRRGAQPGYVQVGRLNFSSFGAVISASVGDDGRILCLGNGGSAGRRVGKFRAGSPLVGRWLSGRYKFSDKQDFGAVWVYGGGGGRRLGVVNVWAVAASAFDDGALPPSFFDETLGSANDVFGGAEVVESIGGGIDINIHCGIAGRQPADIRREGRVCFYDGAVRIKLPENAGDAAEEGLCDCIIHTPIIGAVDWIQIEVVSERGLDYISVAGDRETLVDMKQQVIIHPAPGFIG